MEIPIFVFVLWDALCRDILLAQDAARRQIVGRDPRLRLPDEEDPMAGFEFASSTGRRNTPSEREKIERRR